MMLFVFTPTLPGFFNEIIDNFSALPLEQKQWVVVAITLVFVLPLLFLNSQGSVFKGLAILICLLIVVWLFWFLLPRKSIDRGAYYIESQQYKEDFHEAGQKLSERMESKKQ